MKYFQKYKENMVFLFNIDEIVIVMDVSVMFVDKITFLDPARVS